MVGDDGRARHELAAIINTPARTNDTWKIHSRIPKTDPIHLKVLVQRHRRLEAIDAKRLTELATVAALPLHPWPPSPSRQPTHH
ncbi:hypothetical protein G7085_21000 [Tessaracoccus sp. HDW20]|uniref:hypothetical protein n=1 Tax=Tessaracoccus coleopterorum TaxID=2714950 RepID=UPI0018D4711F|nr:hypothetical protein [Tessaracoccus coleopterorum]NHB86161.1 hypothetical protein [Tessaracoccus coleopterorum]